MKLSTTRRLAAAATIAATVTLAFGLFAPLARAAMRDQSASGLSHAQLQQQEAGGTATGCTGSASSKNADGQVIDTVSSGPPAASRSNPLKVDYDGVVSYDGQSDNIIKNHNWDISIFGVKVKSGGGTNSEERQRDASNEKVSDYIPIRMSGKYFVSFQISGEGGSCSGSLWVEIDENPVGTVPWIIGTGLMLAGVAGAAFSIPSGAAGAAAAAAGASAAAGAMTTGAAGTTPPETVIGGQPSPATPPADDGQVIGGDQPPDGAEPEPPPSADDNGPVIGG